MSERILLGDITVEVVMKNIQNIHLSVHPPVGRVRLAAPFGMSPAAIRQYAISRLPWIRKQRRKLQQQEREQKREILERESHYLWGRRYLLNVIEADHPPQVALRHKQLTLSVRPGANEKKRSEVLDEWYRRILREKAETLVKEWEPRVGVNVDRIFIQRMKTRWGSCNAKARSIRLNSELARKPPECLEYIVVHEMVHILEPTHNDAFQAMMRHLLPNWVHRRQALNQLPLKHEDWGY